MMVLRRAIAANKILRIDLARISHHLTVEARDKPAITALRLLAVLNVLFSTLPRAERRAPCTDGLLTHFASPRGEKSGLVGCLRQDFTIVLARSGPDTY